MLLFWTVSATHPFPFHVMNLLEKPGSFVLSDVPPSLWSVSYSSVVCPSSKLVIKSGGLIQSRFTPLGRTLHWHHYGFLVASYPVIHAVYWVLIVRQALWDYKHNTLNPTRSGRRQEVFGIQRITVRAQTQQDVRAGRWSLQGQEGPWRQDKTQNQVYHKGNSLVIQGLRLYASNVRDGGSIPGWGTKISHVGWHGPENTTKKKKNQNGQESSCWSRHPWLQVLMASTVSMPSVSWPKNPVWPSNPSFLTVLTTSQTIWVGSSVCQGPDVWTCWKWSARQKSSPL